MKGFFLGVQPWKFSLLNIIRQVSAETFLLNISLHITLIRGFCCTSRIIVFLERWKSLVFQYVRYLTNLLLSV